MKLINTGDVNFKPPVTMLIYGNGGVGKSTCASTAPKPLMADCEGGSKYFGQRGINMPVAMIESWTDMKEFLDEAKKPEYETIIIDPLNELMEKLMVFMIKQGNKKNVQQDGNPTMAGWGFLKQTLRSYLKVMRDLNKHLILITHVDESRDDDKLIKRPMLMTKLSQEVVNMVDIVGYMDVAKDENNETKRFIYFQPESDRFVIKDRTGALDKYEKPDISNIITKVQGNKQFAAKVELDKNIEKKEKEFDESLPDLDEKERTVDDVAKEMGGKVVDEKKVVNPQSEGGKKMKEIMDKHKQSNQ